MFETLSYMAGGAFALIWIYVAVRFASVAYFRSKLEYKKQLKKLKEQGEDDNGKSP